jgi:hypothetical protein
MGGRAGRAVAAGCWLKDGRWRVTDKQLPTFKPRSDPSYLSTPLPPPHHHHHQAAEASPPGPEADAAADRAVAAFRRAHQLVRAANMASDGLRYHLRSFNFEAFAVERPPPGHWARVVAAAGGSDALPPANVAEIREVWSLYTKNMVRGGGMGWVEQGEAGG